MARERERASNVHHRSDVRRLWSDGASRGTRCPPPIRGRIEGWRLGREALFPTGVTILRALAVARWLAWGWMVAVVAFSGDAIRHPVAAWAAVGVAFGLAATSTWLARTDAQRLMSVGFLAAEAALALGLDGARRLGVRARPRVRHEPEPGVAVATRRGDLDRRVGRAGRGRRVRRTRRSGALARCRAQRIRAVRPEARRVARGDQPVLRRVRCGVRMDGDAAAAHGVGDRRPAGHGTRWRGSSTTRCCRRSPSSNVESATTDPELAGAAREADRELRAFLFGGDGRPATTCAAVCTSPSNRPGAGRRRRRRGSR